MGDWRISGFHEVRELGTGAQGRVVLARHAGSGHPVAIKYVRRRDGDERAVQRLREEAVLLGRVDDPHVARLYRFVIDRNGAAIVMEAVNGVSLRTILAEHGALGPEAALAVLKGSLLGLAAAHAVGVVHRDYKPANVVVQGDGLSKLVDFGVAAVAGEGSRAGTPAYMAPEQWEGRPATPSTDVYAATCVFFECVTGRRPYRESGRLGLMRQHLHEEVPVEELPEPLRPLVAAGMAQDAGDRPPSAREFLDELERVAAEAYGPDWHRTGVRALAVSAAALSALFPLAAAGLAPAAAAGAATAAAVPAGGAAAGTASGAGAAGVSGAGAGAAGASGAAAAGGGKVAAAVAATAVATAAIAGGVYAVRGGEEPRRTAATASPARSSGPAFTVTVATENRTIPSPRLVISNARYAQVSGMPDAALQARINKALRGPLDEAIGYFRQCSMPDASVRSTVRPGLRTSNLLSVGYQVAVTGVCASPGSVDSRDGVTVDVRTGREITPQRFWLASTLTAAGARTLRERATRTRWVYPSACSGATPSLITQPGPRVDFVLWPNEIEILQFAPDSEPCNDFSLYAPYAKVRDLIRPESAALLPRN